MSTKIPQKPDTYRLVYVGRSSAEIERDFGERLSRLIREGFEVHVMCGDDGAINALSARGALCTPLPVLNPLNIAGLLGAYFILQAYFIEQRPILVHTFDQPLATVGALAAVLADITVIVTSVEAHQFADHQLGRTIIRLEDQLKAALERSLTLLTPAGQQNARQRLAKLPSLRAASSYRLLSAMVDKYLVHNESDLHLVQVKELVEPSKLEMIVGARGVDLSKFDLHDEGFWTQASARQALNLPRAWREVLGFRGVLKDARALQDLVALIDEIARTHPSAGWLLYVDLSGVGGRAGRRARRQLLAHQKNGRARVLGDYDTLPDGQLADSALFYRALDLFVAPLYLAARTGPLMHAAAAGIGTIAYRGSASEASVEHGQTGELVDTGDLSALAEATRRALDAPNLRETYGRRARALALRHFNRQHVEDQVFRIYDTTLEMKLMP